MKLALAYLFALIAVPFYIGPELAPNVQLNVERVLLAGLVFALLTGLVPGVLRGGLRDLLRHRPALLALLLGYTLWRLVAAIASPYRVSLYLWVNEAVAQTLIFIVFFALVARPGFADAMARVLRLALIVAGVIVAVELILGENPLARLAPADAGMAIRSGVIERAGALRAKGPFEHPLTLGNLVIVLLPLALFAHGAGRIARRRGLVIAALIGMAVATGSRATMGLVGLQMLVWLGYGARLRIGGRDVPLLLPALPVIPLAAAGLIALVEARTGQGALVSYVRQAQLVNGLIHSQTAPWLGFGAGPGPVAAIFEAMHHGEGALRLWQANAATVDNWYLSLLLGSGWPSVLLFAAFGLAAALPLTRIALSTEPDAGLAMGLMVALLSNMALMAVLSIFTLHPLFFILAAWAARVSCDHASRGMRPITQRANSAKTPAANARGSGVPS